MATPIGLVSQQSTWDCFQGDDNFALSDIQRTLLEMSGVQVREAAVKYDPRAVGALEVILKSEAQDLTALADAVGQPRHMYRVPSEISDYELLSLKTAGLVQGHGRAVNITDKGKEAVRMQWLNTTNKYKSDKGFQHPMSKQASDEGNVRTASRKRQFASDEFEPRKFASDETSQRKFASEE